MTAVAPVRETPATPSAPETLPQLLLERAAALSGRVAQRHKALGIWTESSWDELRERVRDVALGLQSLGVGAGDRVAIHSENTPEWVWTDLAIQSIGAISVGLYPTNPPAEVRYLLEDSGASVVVTGDQEQLDKALEVADSLPNLRTIVVVDPKGTVRYEDPRLLTFEELLATGREAVAADAGAWEQGVRDADPAACATLIYTSGTTGPPKGVMLSSANIIATLAASRTDFSLGATDEILSYLPLCHVAEKILTIWLPLDTGAVVNFAESIDTVQANLREVQPTFFLGVPRIWEKMKAVIEIRMQDASRLKRALYKASFRMPRRLGWLLVHRALKRRLGMNRCRFALSGAAPIAPEVLEWFSSIGVPIYEAWGMSESAGAGALNRPGDVRVGSVGRPLPGVEIRIADDGEILVRGGTVFMGYWGRPEATAETIDADGWLHTGDVGSFDDDGRLYITDRKKDIIITAGGKNISPAEIENKLKVSPYVREAVVVGDRRKFLSALIGIEADNVGNWAERRGLTYTTYADLSRKAEVAELVRGEVRRVNDELASVEQIKEFRLLPKELDHEDGQLTATQKVKRRAIEDEFATLIEEIYRVTRFLEFFFTGIALGTIYALVALGFVIIYKSTEVINFAHGAILLLGSYLVFQFANEFNWAFVAAVFAAVALTAGFGILIERGIVGRMVGRPVFAIVMVTLGLEVIIRIATQATWTPPELRSIDDPWGISTVELVGVNVTQASIAAFITGMVLIGGFFLFFRYTRTGVAMRATAIDQEAALAVGIDVRLIFALSWAIAGGLAAVAGMFAASAAAGSVGVLAPSNGFIALRAFPAAVVGGLDSPGGAVLGGLLIGLTEVFAGGYLGHLDFLGSDFALVAPYLLMIAVLLIRPWGLFGTREIARV